MKCGVTMKNGVAKLCVFCTNSQFLRGSLESVVPSGHIFTVELKHEENMRKLELIDSNETSSDNKHQGHLPSRAHTRGHPGNSQFSNGFLAWPHSFVSLVQTFGQG